jgi:CubicO group peptidase (beta-lactamase class C family)
MTAASYSGGGGRVAAAVRVNGELRSIATEFPADAVFPIYSITKTLTAICVLRLVETGSLRLVDAARRWLPDVSIPSAITLTHLLRHTSGLRDYGLCPNITKRFVPNQIDRGRDNSFSTLCWRQACSSRPAKGFLIPTSDTCCS